MSVVGTKEDRPQLKTLKPKTVQLGDLKRFPGMTGWFEPVLLLKLLWRVIVSDLFGQYADRRLIQAALDPADKAEFLARADLTNMLPADEEGAVWLDYVSDVGDGFDATYAIAYLLAQPSLAVDGRKLPRGQILVMGGDEVYPTSHRDDYVVKTRLPYSFALPDVIGKENIPLFALPGNHDWYDGLVTFLAIFCRAKPTPFGRWRTNQRRSYFAVKLTETCWLWGIDIALVRDMDQPQADYFVAIAESMPAHASIILCSSEPGWYSAEDEGESWRTLSYAAWIAENAGLEPAKKGLNIPLILSGDSHHYARYSAAGAQYITSGGGGAFLHGTHDLKETISAKWLRENSVLTRRAAYPSPEKSKELLGGNRRFGALNPGLTTALGIIYTALAFLLAVTWRWEVGAGVYLALLGGLYGYAYYQAGHSRKILAAATVHGAAHMTVICAMAWLMHWLHDGPLQKYNVHWLIWLAGLTVIGLTLGRWVAGKIVGYNLLLTCRHLGLNNNDAFSAMKLDGYRHFLRIRIQDNKLTVFPIKLDAVPSRDQWRDNAARNDDLSPSRFVSDPDLRPGFIETPIEIATQYAQSTTDVRTPNEIPKSE